MFDFFRRRPKAAPEEPLDRWLRVTAESLPVKQTAIPTFLSKGDFPHVAMLANSALLDHLERCVMLLRGKGDAAAAWAELDAALEFVAPFEQAVQRLAASRGAIDEAFIPLVYFRHVLTLLMLRQDWARLADVVALSKSPVVAEAGGGIADAIMCMRIATLEMDRTAFDVARRRFEEERQSLDLHYFNVYFTYDQLMSAILDRDAERIAQFMATFEVMFAQRTTDRKLIEDSGFLDGAGDKNAVVFDLETVTWGLWAIHQGIPVTHSSPVVPIREFQRETPVSGS